MLITVAKVGNKGFMCYNPDTRKLSEVTRLDINSNKVHVENLKSTGRLKTIIGEDKVPSYKTGDVKYTLVTYMTNNGKIMSGLLISNYCKSKIVTEQWLHDNRHLIVNYSYKNKVVDREIKIARYDNDDYHKLYKIYSSIGLATSNKINGGNYSSLICLDANNAEDEIIDDDEDESDMIQIDDAEESLSKEQQDEEKEQLKNEIPTKEEVLARNELFVDSMVNFVKTKLNENGIKVTAEEIRNFYNKNIKTNLIMFDSDNYIDARAKNGHFVRVMMLPEGNEDILNLFMSRHTMKLKSAEKDKIDAIHKLVKEGLNKLRNIDRDIKYNAKTKEHVNKLVLQADSASERIELDLFMEFEQLKFTLTPGWNLPDIQATDRDIQKAFDLEREIRVHAEEIKKRLHDNKNKLTQEEYEKAYEDLKDQLNRIDSDIELNKECIKNRKKTIIDETPGLCDLKIDIPDKYDFFDEAETIYVDEDNILTRAIHSLLDQIYYCTENMYKASTFRELEDSIDEGDL